MEKRQSPLDGIPELSMDQVRESIASAMERSKEEKLDEDDRLAMRGRYAPPEGTCRVCGGRTVAKVVPVSTCSCVQVIGPGSGRSLARNEGWHCVDCGVRYEFCTPAGVTSGR